MLDATTHILKRALWACFAAFVMVAPVAHAASNNPIDADLRNKLRAFDAALKTLPDLSRPAAALITQAGLADVTATTDLRAAPGFATFGDERAMVEAKPMDLRLALGLISQIYGAKDNFDVLYAQRDQSYPALVFNRGDVTLADIFEQLKRHGIQDDMGEGRNLLKAPVIIWGEAALTMTQGERLLMSRSDGAVLINFGRVTLDGAIIETVGEANPAAPDFIPFVANGGGAAVNVRNSQFIGLGFGNEMKFSGFSVVRNPLLVRKDEVVIENNSFVDVAGLGVSMADGVMIRNNRVHNTRSASIAVTHSKNARILGNLITGDAPTNGIRLLQGSSHGVIEGNVIMAGDRAGVVVRNDSDHAQVRHNVVWRRGGGGIALTRVRCGVVAENVVMDNRQKGIEVRTSRDIVVRANKIIGNRSSGVWVSAQKEGYTTLILDNLLLGNGSGLASATGEVMALSGNDLTRQFPRFLDGDLSTQTRAISANLDGEIPLVLTAGGRMDVPLPQVGCTQH